MVLFVGSVSNDWKWTETPEFASDCERLPGDASFIHWVVTEAVLARPLQGSKPLFPHGDPSHDMWIRWFRTLEAPGLGHMWPRIVVFRVEPEPVREGEPRELTGLALLEDDEA